MKLLLALMLCAQLTFSQDNPVNRLLIAGERAFVGQDYVLAKKIYSQALALNPGNRDALYNLGATYLSLGETENACENWYQLSLLRDYSGVKYITEYCPDFRKGSVVSFKDLDEKPRFILRGKEYPLFENELLNPLFLNAFRKRFSNSTYLNKVDGRSHIIFKVNKDSKLECDFIRVGAKEQDRQEMKKTMESFMRTLVVYVAGTKNGQAVDYFEVHSLPIIMERN